MAMLGRGSIQDGSRASTAAQRRKAERVFRKQMQERRSAMTVSNDNEQDLMARIRAVVEQVFPSSINSIAIKELLEGIKETVLYSEMERDAMIETIRELESERDELRDATTRMRGRCVGKVKSIDPRFIGNWMGSQYVELERVIEMLESLTLEQGEDGNHERER